MASAPAWASASDPCEVLWRLDLDLDRDLDDGLHRLHAARARGAGTAIAPLDVLVVITIWRTPSSRTAASATRRAPRGASTWVVAPARSDSSIVQKRQRVSSLRVADARLHHRRRQHVGAVQPGELLVLHALRRPRS